LSGGSLACSPREGFPDLAPLCHLACELDQRMGYRLALRAGRSHLAHKTLDFSGKGAQSLAAQGLTNTAPSRRHALARLKKLGLPGLDPKVSSG
jgi:hypothetical protein